MGDRTYVTLSILTTQVEDAKPFIDGWSNTGTWFEDVLTYFNYEEVNNGDLHFLSALQAAGIAYESQWEAGYEFGEGTQYLRFTDTGEAIIKSVYESETSIQLSTLLMAIDDHDQLRELIRAREEEIFVLPWDNQLEYSKLYRLKQLITT